jgi:hypothetical protein
MSKNVELTLDPLGCDESQIPAGAQPKGGEVQTEGSCKRIQLSSSFLKSNAAQCIYILLGSTPSLYVIPIKALANSKRVAGCEHVFIAIPLFFSFALAARRLLVRQDTIKGVRGRFLKLAKVQGSIWRSAPRPVRNLEALGGVAATRITGACWFGNDAGIERCSRSSNQSRSSRCSVAG